MALTGTQRQLFTIAEKLVADLPEILDTSPSATTPVDHYLMELDFTD